MVFGQNPWWDGLEGTPTVPGTPVSLSDLSALALHRSGVPQFPGLWVLLYIIPQVRKCLPKCGGYGLSSQYLTELLYLSPAAAFINNFQKPLERAYLGHVWNMFGACLGPWEKLFLNL